MRSGHHTQINNKMRRTVTLDGAGGAPAVTPAEYEGSHNQWDESTSHDSAKDNQGDVTEGRDKSQGYDGAEDVDGVRRYPRQTAPYLRTQRMLKQYNQSCGYCSDSSTTEKEAQAQHTRKMPRPTPEPMISTKRPCRPWTLWQMNTRSSRRP